MKRRISAVIFDKDCKMNDYSKVKTNKYFEYEEESFDITVYDNDDDIDRKLNSARGFDAIITVGNIYDYQNLFWLPFNFRKKWMHADYFDGHEIADMIVATFKNNIGRVSEPLFSIFTCAYKTPKKFVDRLYNSLKAQTYNNWNWWILDDNKGNFDTCYSNIKDPRVTIIKNITNHGNIGFNKHMIAMCCDGDYLVEVDHDDELTPDCLEMLKKAFSTYKDCDFVYSYCMEEIDGASYVYDEGWGLGLGETAIDKYNGEEVKVPGTPDMNALSIRHIVSMPNHVRCWKKEFYHRIGGHNTEMSVMDDADLLIRTFINGKSCKIPKMLYIQHEGDTSKSDRGSTTQAERFGEIQRMGRILLGRYDYDIHEFLVNNGIDDVVWNDNGYSEIFNGKVDGLVSLNYTLEV